MTSEPAAPTTTATRAGSRSRTIFWLAAVTVAVIHLVLTNHFVPAKAVFADTPIAGFAFDRHAGQVFRVVKALRTSGESWLYDVQLHAGQPEGTVGDLDSKGWELWTYALNRLGCPISIAFNSFVWFWMLTGPLWIFASARSFGLTAAESLVAAAMAVSLWFFDSFLHWAWFSGMLGWCAAASLCLLALGLHVRFIRDDSTRAGVASAVLAAVASLLHPASLLIMLPALLYTFARGLAPGRRAQLAWPLLLLLAGACSNASWLRNALEHRAFLTLSAQSPVSSLPTFVCDVLEIRCRQAPSGETGTRAGFRLLYLGLAAAGLYSWRSERDGRWAQLSAALILLYGFSYLGEFVPGLRSLHSYQLLIPAMLLTTVPAAGFAARLPQLWANRSIPREVLALFWILSFGVGRQLAATQVAYFLPHLVPVPKIYPDGARSPLSKFGYVWLPDLPDTFRFGIPQDPLRQAGTEPIRNWLQKNVRPGARLLIYDPVLAEHVALRTTFEVMSGPRQHSLAHAHAHPFAKRTGPERDSLRGSLTFAQQLHSYGIEWLVGDRRHRRMALHALAPTTAVAGRHVYRIKQPGSRILRGGGHIDAKANTISVRNSDPSQPLVLSYHFHAALRCRPACKVERFASDVDDIGFIAVPAPHPPDLVIWLSYDD